jgi:integrase
MFYILGINLGLRVSDYLPAKVGYFRKACADGRITLVQEKTEKPVNFAIPEDAKKVIELYIKDKEDDELMFPSRKGNDAITRFGVLAILKAAAEEAGIKNNIGCHSLRKTFGYWHYKRTKDIRTLMQIFNHSREEVALRYIGVTQEDIDNSLRGFSLGILNTENIEPKQKEKKVNKKVVSRLI